MKHSIIGAGKIGTALARVFARHRLEVGLANTRGLESLGEIVRELGNTVVAQTVKEACAADTVWLAVPFKAVQDVAQRASEWKGRTVVDLTNAFGVSSKELHGLLSSEFVSASFPGARLVKGFNHLPAAQLGVSTSPTPQVVFLSSNDRAASAEIAAVAEQLGFAAVQLGRLDQGGVPLHIVDGQPGGLIFQNVAKLK